MILPLGCPSRENPARSSVVGDREWHRQVPTETAAIGDLEVEFVVAVGRGVGRSERIVFGEEPEQMAGSVFVDGWGQPEIAREVAVEEGIVELAFSVHVAVDLEREDGIRKDRARREVERAASRRA